MTHTPTKKQQTHQRILDAAGQSFRSNGYAGIGVDGIAKAAGATSGAFYAHFGSKDGAFLKALEAGLDEVITAIPTFQREYGADWVKAFVDYYLGKAHRDDMTRGCAMTTLTPEVARAGSEPQSIYEKKMAEIANLIANGLADGNRDARIARARALLGILIGGLNMTRAMNSDRARDAAATAIKSAAIGVAGPARNIKS